MNHSFFIRSFECVRDLLGRVQCSFKRELSLKRFSRHQLHHQCADTARLFDAVNCCDVGMIQQCENFGFPLEPCEALRVLNEGSRQNLDRYVTIQFGVARGTPRPCRPRRWAQGFRKGRVSRLRLKTADLPRRS